MATGVSHTFQSALERSRSGERPAGDRDGLRFDTSRADHLHLLGIAAFQRKEHVAAVDYIGQAIDAECARPEYHNSLGTVYRALGQPVEAIDAFREALRLKPDFSDAYNNLGIVLADCGQDRGALACFERAAQLDPRNALAWTNLGSALVDLGEMADAGGCFECAIDADPRHAHAYALLGKCRARAGRHDEAIVAFETASELGGESVELLKALASGYLQVGRSGEAERVYRRAIEYSPSDPLLLLNLAQALKDQKKHAEAIDWYRRGLQLDPHNAAAHYALGRALHQHDQFADAIASYQRAISLGMRDAGVAYHLGNACKSLKRFSEAIEAYLEALERDPEFIPPRYQLGNAYRQMNDLDGARMCLEKVLDRRPDDLTTLVSLGNVLKEQDNLVGARAAFSKVIRHLPDEPLWELWLATLCPAVFHTSVGIAQYRGQLLEKLKSLARRDVTISPQDITDRGCPPPYNLQFHGCDDRPLKEAYARVFRQCLAGQPRQPFGSPSVGGKPRVGFVVTDGHEGVFLRYFGGALRGLDREAFDPVLICSAGGERRIRTEVDASVIETLVVPSRFDQIVERVRDGRFAVLYHWEVGSDVTNYFLPFFRLAPIQCTGAGVPVTTGIPQINYFLSDAVCEPDGADAAYTERLIRSSSLLTCQRRGKAPADGRRRNDFGVQDGEHFYLCPHKIEKFHPDFDGLLAEILRRDPRAVVAIPKDRQGYAARKLANRLRFSAPHVFERIRFVPYQSLDGYFSLLAAADVLLDPIYYGGGLTSFDGFSVNKPIVTLPGRFVRGRYTYGSYRRMGLDDCVAATPEHYVDLAVGLGTDRDLNRSVCEKIGRSSDVLFEADDSIVEYNQIFRRLVDEALRT